LARIAHGEHPVDRWADGAARQEGQHLVCERARGSDLLLERASAENGAADREPRREDPPNGNRGLAAGERADEHEPAAHAEALGGGADVGTAYEVEHDIDARTIAPDAGGGDQRSRVVAGHVAIR